MDKDPFEFNAEKYKKASVHQQEWGKELISEFDFSGSEKILDLGCGDGGLTAYLADLVPAGFITGIDASENMINSAQKTHKSKNLRFKLMNINEIDFKDEFDVIVSNATLHWIKDHDRLLLNVCKALKADGIARFNFAANGNCATFFKVVREVMAQKQYADDFQDFDWPWTMPIIEEYELQLKNFNFSEIKVWGENADKFFPDKEAMIGWLDQPSLVPFLKHINNPNKKSFRDTVVERMVEETIQSDGKYFETFRRINVFAKK